VELYATGDLLVLAIEDDGVGFDVARRRTGAGITGMEERVSLVGGRIVVDSELGMGTHVIVEVPLQP
jgi:signal transduction histidine kinase